MVSVGFIGFGEAASELAKGLSTEGITSITAYDVMMNHDVWGEKIKNKAAEIGIELAADAKEVLNRSEIVFVAVPANNALEVAQTVKNDLTPNTIYVDVTASTPKTKIEISTLITSVGCLFVDVAMLGSLPVYKHKVPIILSGSGANQFTDKMKKYGMDLVNVGKEPGTASAVKLIRSIFMKGVSALYIELLEAAYTYKVEDIVLKSVSKTMDAFNFEQTLNRLVTGNAIHAERRAIELNGSIEMLSEMELDSRMTCSARDKLEYFSKLNLKEKLNGDKPSNWKDVLKLYL
ncbi:NAD(P)-binding domain-containing protein [Bacillus sp. FJAT-27245]|uniref:NAD(P)-binding domain-containing protein n=1 Tax=Bacillus sp. FJAT-27245 TaxID=1684144 RepID=UPI0006A7E5A5|nr:NAD(P)-binding domain-containing protein [Bacillus sp. FJAT-27245]